MTIPKKKKKCCISERKKKKTFMCVLFSSKQFIGYNIMIYNLEFSCRVRCGGETTLPSLNTGKFLWEHICVHIDNIMLLASFKGFNFIGGNCGKKEKKK